MSRMLRGWLESSGLPAIIAGVLGAVLLISMGLVLGGYLIVSAMSGI